MDSSEFLAQFMGLYMVLLGLPLIFTPESFRERYESFINNAGELLFAGIFTLLLGLAFVIVHNIWVSNWRVLITILSWSTLIEGISMIYFPEKSRLVFRKLIRKLPCVGFGIFSLLLGLFLTAKGFF